MCHCAFVIVCEVSVNGVGYEEVNYLIPIEINRDLA